jgi:ATP-dependent protease Clp ATPase subunit
MSTPPSCAVCGKEQEQVKRLVLFLKQDNQKEGICDECVSLFVQILANDLPDWCEEQMAYLLAITGKNSN